MTNKALNTLRRGLDVFARGDSTIMNLVDQAIAHAVKEATSEPEHQYAVQQARLTKAKADLLELQVAEQRGTKTQIAVRANLFEEPFWIDTSKMSEADLEKMREVMRQPGGRIEVLRPGMPPYKYIVPAGIAERARDDRMERYRALEAARRERSLAKDAEQKIRTAELRGFQKARLAMLRSIIDAQDSDDGLTKKQFSLLMRFKSFVSTMQMEG